MTKRLTFPKCGTCDLAMTLSEDPKVSIICHGAPPSAFTEFVAVMGTDNVPTQEKRISSAFPPVARDTPGCAMHPQIRRKLK
jgi:hypothetical protein